MRIALALLIGVHGLIHLFGFLKAMKISEFKQLTQPISREWGMMWLLAFVLFVLTSILYLDHSNVWWVVGIMAVVLSQVLIIAFWRDAKWGTLFNVILLLPVFIGYSTYSFDEKMEDEIVQMLSRSSSLKTETLTYKKMEGLPHAVQNWLMKSGAIGRECVQEVYLEQKVEMRMDPEQENWVEASAQQYFTISPPAFHWTVQMDMNPVMRLVGRDQFERGEGEMDIRLWSIISFVDARDNKRVDQAALQRYLAELVWFPSAATSDYITWEPIDDFSALATMNYEGTTGSGVFHFDAKGNFERFEAMRYRQPQDKEPIPWTVRATHIGERNGVMIPVVSEVIWGLETGDWTWLKVRITDIEYSPIEMR